MKKGRLLAAVLLAAMLTCACTAEKVSENDTVANQIPGDSVAAETEESVPTFDGAEWTVLHYDATDLRYYFAPEEFSDVLNDAAYERNAEVERKYEVVIKQAIGSNNGMYSELKNAVSAGDAVYDAVVPQSSEPYTSMVVEGLISDLNLFDELKLDKEWWYPEVKDLLTIGGHLYFTGNYYTITCTNLFTLLYNKELM